MIKKAVIGIVCIAAGLQATWAQDSTRVLFDSGFGGAPSLFDQSTNALTGGTTADGNGAVLQLGYYSGASAANNFTGTWVPLSGEGSLNIALVSGASPAETYNKTSIGDLNGNGAGNGSFALFLDFTVGSVTSGNSLPSSNTIPLSIRFYNGTTIAGSTFFNVVSDDAWLWKTPATPQATLAISLDDPGLEWLSTALGQSAANAFHTTVAIPEPSTLVSLIVGGAAFAFAGLRRRSKS